METNLGGENYFTYFLSLGFKSKLCAFVLFLCALRLYAFKRKRPTLYYLNKKIKTFNLKVFQRLSSSRVNNN